MCGVVGICQSNPGLDVAADLVGATLLLQHRGQDACGFVTGDLGGTVHCTKGSGPISQVISPQPGRTPDLRGNFGIAHVRYATNGHLDNSQIQPILASEEDGLAIAHNGHLVNSRELNDYLTSNGLSESHRKGDSELILDMILSKRSSSNLNVRSPMIPDWLISGVEDVYTHCIGSFACLLLIPRCGLLAFRDANGIKPIIMAERKSNKGCTEYMFASESIACTGLGYTPTRDLRPGEAIFVSPHCSLGESSRVIARQIVPTVSYSPDIFEYVYFARAESVIDGISVRRSRQYMGKALAQTIHRDLAEGLDIDCIVPVPETSLTCALEVSKSLQRPLVQGLIRNRSSSRTFILPTQQDRAKAVACKFRTVGEEFDGKNVLIVDDSIVRGTTAMSIVKMARNAGAKKVYFAAGSPAIRFKHIHGIDLADEKKLIAHGRSVTEIEKELGTDGLFYLSLEDLVEACVLAGCHGCASSFEVGVFNGTYTSGPLIVDGQF